MTREELISLVLLFAFVPLTLVLAVVYLKMIFSDNGDHGSGRLFWVTTLFTVALVGLTMYMAYLQKQGLIPTWCWVVVAVLFGVILVLRRLLKWR